jgi:hypothetical protein
MLVNAHPSQVTKNNPPSNFPEVSSNGGLARPGRGEKPFTKMLEFTPWRVTCTGIAAVRRATRLADVLP